MSHLASLLWKPFNFFRINLKPELPAKPGVARIFPLGGAILLPDSLFVSRPDYVTRILKWFRGFILQAKAPQTWKLLTRPRLREWILNIIEKRGNARSDAEKELPDPFMDVFQEISFILPVEEMDPSDDFETPLEGASFVSASHIPGYDLDAGFCNDNGETMKRNEDLLVEWYARWSLDRFEEHRKFAIIHEGSRDISEVKKLWGSNRHVSASISPNAVS